MYLHNWFILLYNEHNIVKNYSKKKKKVFLKAESPLYLY